MNDAQIDQLLTALERKARELNKASWVPFTGATWEPERVQLRVVVRDWLVANSPECSR